MTFHVFSIRDMQVLAYEYYIITGNERMDIHIPPKTFTVNRLWLRGNA